MRPVHQAKPLRAETILLALNVVSEGLDADRAAARGRTAPAIAIEHELAIMDSAADLAIHHVGPNHRVSPGRTEEHEDAGAD